MIPLLVLVVALAQAGTVTIPLPEFKESIKKDAAKAPPVSAGVSSQRLNARTGDDGSVEVNGHFVLDVLSENWSTLCFFRLSPGIQVLESPRVENVTVAAINGELCVLSKKPGNYNLELKLRSRIERIVAGRDALWSPLELDGQSVLMKDGGWSLRSVLKPVAKVERPPMEPVIVQAKAQLVSTVEGRVQLKLRYRLQLDRPQPLTFDVPAQWKVERIYINGAATLPESKIVVNPVKDNEAEVELNLTRELGVFNLAGKLAFEMPQASWPTRRFDAQVQLPSVFDYQRVGGSLEPSSDSPESSEFPGRVMMFKQHLVAASGPTLELKYAVDLAGRYFSRKGRDVSQ